MWRLIVALLLLPFAAHADAVYKRGFGSGGSSGGSSGGLATFVESDSPVDGSDPCNKGDLWVNTTTGRLFSCVNGTTDDWTEITAA